MAFSDDLFARCHSLDDKVELFCGRLFELYDVSCPMRVKVLSYKSFCTPWLTESLRARIDRKHFLFRQYKHGLTSFQTYNSFKNSLTNDSRRAKSLYFRNKFKRFNGDIRKTWTTIKHVLRGNNYKTNSITLLNNNVQVSDFGKVAGIFNDYFSSVAVNLDHNIPQSNVDPLYYLPHRNSNSMFATPSTINEVAAAITGLPLKGCNSKSNHRASLRTYLIYCPQ